METRDANGFGAEGGAVDHVELEDGTLLLFDPDHSEAWVECRSPVYLPGQT